MKIFKNINIAKKVYLLNCKEELSREIPFHIVQFYEALKTTFKMTSNSIQNNFQ